MTTIVEPIPKEKVTELISALFPSKITQEEEATFLQFVQRSSCLRVAFLKGELLCIWGLIVQTFLSQEAYLWLHVTEAAREHQFVLVRQSQMELARMLKDYPHIVGHCEIGEALSIRWLRWLGAHFGKPEGKLIPFTIRGLDG